MARILNNSWAAFKWIGLGGAIRHFNFCINAAIQRNADKVMAFMIQMQLFSREE